MLLSVIHIITKFENGISSTTTYQPVPTAPSSSRGKYRPLKTFVRLTDFTCSDLNCVSFSIEAWLESYYSGCTEFTSIEFTYRLWRRAPLASRQLPFPRNYYYNRIDENCMLRGLLANLSNRISVDVKSLKL